MPLFAFYCCDKHHNQQELMGERIYSIFQLTVHHFQLTSQEPGSRNWNRHITKSAFLSVPQDHLPTGQYFLSWCSLFPDDSSLCHVDKKQPVQRTIEKDTRCWPLPSTHAWICVPAVVVWIRIPPCKFIYLLVQSSGNGSIWNELGGLAFLEEICHCGCAFKS